MPKEPHPLGNLVGVRVVRALGILASSGVFRVLLLLGGAAETTSRVYGNWIFFFGFYEIFCLFGHPK